MKLVALLALALAACGGSSSSSSDAGKTYPECPQHRVEGVECYAPGDAGTVLMKDGLRCAICAGVDSTGKPTAQPLACKTIAGGDLCVATCDECS